MARYYNPSKRLSEWVAALLSPYIKLEDDGGGDGVVHDEDDANKSIPPSASQLLSLGLWSGYVELKNVELRPEAFEQFLNCDGDNHGSRYSGDGIVSIRWKLLQGSIDSVKIQIPWKSILVGSVYSTSKSSAEGIKNQDDEKDMENEEPALASSSDCTSINIQGVRLRLGYEVIHTDPLVRTWQQRQREPRNLNESNSSERITSLEDQLQVKIRDEKNRILQIAERRLRAGVDPFPPSLLDGLNSLMSNRNKKSIPLHSEATSTTSTYLSRIENYVSSTIKSLIWRVFGSLSLSITQIYISGVGQSHYDKYSNEGETRPGDGKRRHRKDQDYAPTRLRRNKTRQSTGVNSMENINDVENALRRRWHSDAEEGEVEVGFALNRLDVRPSSLSNPGNKIQFESVAKKHISFGRLVAFVRRIPMISDVGGADGFNSANAGLWKDSIHEDDYVVLPMDFSASCTVFRNGSESSKDWLTSMSGTAETSIGSDVSASTRRRGKRDKIRMSTSLMSDPLPPRNASSKKLGDDSVSSGTAGFFSPRIEMKLSVGHIRSCVSPRQIFLLQSLSTSMARILNGRPATTIRAAKVYDRRLYARMAEEGECVMAWDDHIYRALPSLQSCFAQRSMRPLPKVVSFWWKYAYLNVVSGINRRKRLPGRESSIMSGGMHSERSWSLAKQSRIREEYIDLYLSARVTTASPTGAVELAGVNSRLEKIEDELNVEQILLLRHVAWKASINCSSADRASRQELSHSSPSKMYYFFSKNSFASETENGLSLHRQLSSNTDVGTLTSSLNQKNERSSQASVIGATEKRSAVDAPEKIPRGGFISFSAKVFISGLSIAICDFSSGSVMTEAQATEADQTDMGISSDDISALTGYSDDDSKTIMQLSVEGTTFDPYHRFWSVSRHGLHCDLIMLMHIADVVFSLRSQEDDDLHSQLVKCEFSVGEISIQSGHASQQQTILYLGYIPSGEPPSEQRIECKESIGVSGRSFNSSHSFIICSAKVIVDWGWLENMQKFASSIEDGPVVAVAGPHPGNQFGIASYGQNKTLRKDAIVSLNIGVLTLTTPLDRVPNANASNEEQFLNLATKNVHLKSGNIHYDPPMKSFEIITSSTLVNEVESSSCTQTSNNLVRSHVLYCGNWHFSFS